MDYRDLNPSILKPGLTTPDGLDLKPSLVTTAYSGGTPSAANQIKPSLRNADGSLKSSIANANLLKPSMRSVRIPHPESFYVNFASQKSLAALAGPTPVFGRPSVGYYLNAAGVMVQAAGNEPRFQHRVNGPTIESVGLLMEAAATNLLTYSGDLSSGTWVKNNLTVAAAPAPDGTNTAWLITESTDGSPTYHRFYKSFVPVLDADYTVSIYVKAGTRSTMQINCTGGFPIITNFDLINKTYTDVYANPLIKCGIETLPNGWLRCWCTRAATSAVSANVQFWIGTGNYTGAGADGFTVWCPQVENIEVPTSPIVTAATTLTRSADALSLSGVDFAGVYATNGMLLADISAPANMRDVTFAQISDGTASNMIGLGRDAGGDYVGTVKSGGVATFADALVKAPLEFERIVSGVSFAPANTLLAVKGVSGTVDTDAAGPIGANRLDIGAGLNGCIASVRLFKTQADNATFVGLTGAVGTIPPDALAVEHIFRIITDGNSLTAPTSISYPEQMMSLLAGKMPGASLSNIGVGAQNTTTMNADRESQVHPLIVDGQTIIVPWEISNHIYTLGATAREAVDEMWVYCDAVRALGAKVVMATPTPRSIAATPVYFESRRQEACTLMRNEWRSHADAFVDIALDSRIGLPGCEEDETYYSGDLVHMNGTGYGVVAELMLPGVLAAAQADTYTEYEQIALSSSVAKFSRISSFAAYKDSAPNSRIRFRCSYPEILLQFRTATPVSGTLRSVGVVLVDGVHYATFAMPPDAGATLAVPVTGSGTRLVEVILPISHPVEFLGVQRFGGGAISQPTSPRPTKRILVCGDSIVQGFSATTVELAWAYRLGQLQNASIINHGFGSARISDLISDNLGQYRADKIVVVGGYNDFNTQQPLSSFKANMQTILDNIRAIQPTAKVFLGGPWWTSNTNTLTPAMYRTQVSDLVSAAADANTVLIDTLAATTNDVSHHPDGIHPNDLGHAQIAAFLNTLLGA